MARKGTEENAEEGRVPARQRIFDAYTEHTPVYEARPRAAENMLLEQKKSGNLPDQNAFQLVKQAPYWYNEVKVKAKE